MDSKEMIEAQAQDLRRVGNKIQASVAAAYWERKERMDAGEEQAKRERGQKIHAENEAISGAMASHHQQAVAAGTAAANQSEAINNSTYERHHAENVAAVAELNTGGPARSR